VILNPLTLADADCREPLQSREAPDNTHLGRARAGKEEDERALGRAERRHASIRPLELKSEMSTVTKFLKSVLVHLT
jgi:hypothetical protein